ncbi:mRNA cleavage and polyadenylation factor subunit [Rhinocladiella similis]
MQCYTELLPPSGVTQSLSASFTSAKAENLIVARTSVLQIFQYTQFEHDTKLSLVAEYNLAGTVTSLGKVRIPDSKSGGDAVLVAFLDAKLSLVEWDPTLHSISTVSIHYYEQHDIQSAPWQPDLADCVSRLSIDPSSRCAAYNFGISNLAIIPFHQTGDDLAMEDFDDVDGEEKGHHSPSKNPDDTMNDHSTPYGPSFVLPLTVLDPGLFHPVDIAFLHEYRDPTIGIVYSTMARSSNMSAERRDVTIYAVYALDLEQKASTTLQSVQKLPNDIYRILALPLPVGGALLIGGNELIHVDQGGKASAVAVNEFAKDASSFPMTDHSEYRLKLEGCQIEHLGNAAGDMLIILSTGDLVLLSFRMDGRSVTGIALRRIAEGQMQSLQLDAASCTANLGSSCLFIGGEDCDSVVVSVARKSGQLKRVQSRVKSETDVFEPDGDEDDLEDEDDLYGEIYSGTNGHSSADASGQTLRVMDRLPCIAPINSFAFGNSKKRKRDDTDATEGHQSQERELVVAYGKGHAGGIAFLSRQLAPTVTKRFRFEGANGLWCLASKQAQSEGDQTLTDLVIVSQYTSEGVGLSSLCRLSEGNLDPVPDSEFDEMAGPTVSISQLKNSGHTIQVLPTEIRVYDSKFALSQIFPIVDEDDGQLAKAVKTTFAEPYLAVIRDDRVMTLLKADKAGELDEVDLPGMFQDKTILSASLYQDRGDFFQTSRFYGDAGSSGPVLSVLTTDGHFCLLSLPNISLQVFQCDSLPFLPTYLMQDLQIPKHWRNKDDIGEILLADLGDTSDRRPFLVVRNLTGDVVLYEPFAIPDVAGSFKFRKAVTKAAENLDDQADEEGEESSLGPMQVVSNVGGRAAVFVPGAHPWLMLREASTMPRIYELKLSGTISMVGINTPLYPQGLAFLDGQQHVCFGHLPDSAVIGQSDWSINRFPFRQDISSIAYFEPTNSYVLAMNSGIDFQLPQDDEWHPEWQAENANLLPSSIHSSLKLISAESHSVISQYHFDACERVLCIKTLNLEVSEETHERKEMVVVGTAIVKGENVTTRGNIYIFDVVDVVPEPGLAESDLKLKLIMKEDVRGAVSAICDIGSQGFLLAAQGQKCMVRGLKEDMSILPVAFLDMRYYVHVAKELRGTGLCILGDAFSGLWLTGYSEEPYKLQIISRDLENPPVLAAEFLPDGKQLFIVSADGDGMLRILQYDPENPKAERGTKLLLRSTFNAGTLPTQMSLLPPQMKNVAGGDADPDAHMDVDGAGQIVSLSRILIATQSGSLCMVTPLPESAYRRLSTLQNTLLTTLDFQPCSLNPRAYRQVETDGIGGRGIIDGNLVKRWWETSTQQRVASADKAGGSVWEVRADMELISGGDLGF